MSSAQVVTSADFEQEVLQSAIPVMVDFWAEWCGPCKMLGPTIDQLSIDYVGKVKIVKLDVQAEPSLASKYAVASIPSLLIFKGGTVVDRMVGAQPKQQIAAKLDMLLK